MLRKKFYFRINLSKTVKDQSSYKCCGDNYRYDWINSSSCFSLCCWSHRWILYIFIIKFRYLSVKLLLQIITVLMISNKEVSITQECTLKIADAGNFPSAIKYRNDKTGEVSMGSLKTQIDRKVSKILWMLGVSSNPSEQITKNISPELQQPLQTSSPQKKELQISQQNQVVNSQELKQFTSLQKIASFMQPNDLSSNEDSTESLTKKTIQQNSIYKIFGLKSRANSSSSSSSNNKQSRKLNGENQLDNMFIYEQNIQTPSVQNQATQNFKICEANFEHMSPKPRRQCIQRELNYIQKTVEPRNKSFQSFRKQSQRKSTANKENVVSSIKKALFEHSSTKISVRQFLDNNGHANDTSLKESLRSSPMRKQSINQNSTKFNRSSAKKHTWRGSTIKREQNDNKTMVNQYMMNSMQDYLQKFMNNRKCLKQSAINNVRISMLKRIQSKCSHALKPFGSI